ncbi:MAG: protein translocase subunit SecF [Syntrophales bacterium]|nr:protein translocase subunit SecF [Syntrophales bacterium]
MQILKRETQIDFAAKMKFAAILSLAVIITGIISLIYHGGPRLGIEFSGGTVAQIRFQEAAATDQVRSAMDKGGFEDSDVQQVGATTGNEFLVRIDVAPSDLRGMQDRIEGAMEAAFGAGKYEIRRMEAIGPKVGRDMTRKGIWALTLSLIAILVYVSIRFEFSYALGGIVALFHDVLITVGVFSLLGKEFTLQIVAALLTIIGYSINDTIVIFDRVRENLKKGSKRNLRDIINLSVNQTLSRTILTSLTVFFVLLALYALGGPVIHDFAFALLIGTVAGVYSTVFIAGPLVLAWESLVSRRRRRK